MLFLFVITKLLLYRILHTFWDSILWNLDKDKFIKILAHDLKSPFTTLMGFSSLLLKNIYNYDIETIKEHLEVINDASSQTYEMLEEILIWLKSQSGQIIYNPKEIMFSEICDEVLNSINILAKDKNISLEFNCHINDTNVYVDKNMTKTILRNLISNAIKFSKPNGKIKIIQEILDNETLITVSDHGIGISQEDINLIWNPLQTINSLGTSGEKGTGLGLSICKEFVEKQGGRIWVESKLSEGSNFKFTLPLAMKEEKT
ncbi:MAG: sensor histidine kinase [Bacteroidales bacterium]